MNVTIVADAGNADGTIGGAELTMREFALAAPDDVTLTDDLASADVVIVGNCVTFAASLVGDLDGKHVVRYHNDLARHEDPGLCEWLERYAEHVFTSPIHRDLYDLAGDWPVIPPALDLDAFKPTRQVKRNGKRAGSCAIASWQGPGKGQQLLREWSDTHEPVDVYGTGAYTPHSANLNVQGPLEPHAVAGTLWRYARFVHLPTAPEPFGRAVVEAWAAGCELVVNRQVGALHFIENDQDALRTAAADFWKAVLS